MSSHRKGPAVADTVKLRNPSTMEEIEEVSETAKPFFVAQGYEVLDVNGNVSGSATAAAKKGN